MSEKVPNFPDPGVTVPGMEMEEISPADEMDEFIAQFLPMFDLSFEVVLGDTMGVEGRLLEEWDDEERLVLLRELAVSHIAQSQQQAVLAMPWSQLFFEELAVAMVTGVRAYMLGVVGTPRTEEGAEILRRQLAEWSDHAVETLASWMEGTIDE